MLLLLQTYRVNKILSLPHSFLSNANNEQSFQAYVTKEGGFCASENVTISPKIGVVRVSMHSKNENPNQYLHHLYHLFYFTLPLKRGPQRSQR